MWARGRVAPDLEDSLSIAVRVSLLPELGELGVVPASHVDEVLDSIVDVGDYIMMYLGLRWWTEHGDTDRLRRARRRWQASRSAEQGWGGFDHEQRGAYAEYMDSATAGYIALAEGDSAAALRVLESLSYPNDESPFERWKAAELLLARGDSTEAAQQYAQLFPDMLDYGLYPHWVQIALERARLNEALGNRDVAIRDYRFVARAWRDADEPIRQYAEEAAAALARLGADAEN